MTRDPAATRFPAGVEVVHGDLADPATLPGVLAGVDRLHLFPFPQTATEVVALASKAEVRRVTVLSSGSVTAGYDTDYQLPVEQAVEASGLEWTHLRPGEFAANRLALWGPSIRAERVVRWPYPDEVGVLIHEADIAVAVHALLEDGHAGRAYDMTGPAALCVRDQVAAIAAAIGGDVRLEQVSRAEALRRLEEQGGWAAVDGPFLLGYEGFSATRTTRRSPPRSYGRCRRSSRSPAARPAASPSGPLTTPTTSAEVSRRGAPGGCEPRSGRRGRGSGRTRQGRRRGRG
jgi:uncharacterized protein YbjT (DUF2867 family)